MYSLKTLFCTLALITVAVPADGNAFLARTPEAATTAVSEAFAKKLLAEIETILGSAHRSFTEKRLDRIQDDLRPTFESMPKNENGRLDHQAVAYLLHRVFVQRHGWFVRGLSPTEQVNSSSAAGILGDRVPDYVVQLFEKRIGRDGIDLHDLAVLAATIEHLAHTEALARLRLSYEAHALSPDDVISIEEADLVLDSYMCAYILGFTIGDGTIDSLTVHEVRMLSSNINQLYPNWGETQEFVREVKHKLSPTRDYLYFADVANVVEELGEAYGGWQDKECMRLRGELIAMEDRKGSGRVLLADFYHKALHQGDWQFSESTSYLQGLGALDRSDPQKPRLLIANYMNGNSNCVAHSTYYSVCCRDTCEALMGQIEQAIAAPDAAVQELANLASLLPSSSGLANQSLTPWLRKKLDEVGEHHGGRIPLHGRLFAQWMHFAFPRECAYPNLAGTVRPIEMQELLNDTDAEFTATSAEMEQYVGRASKSSRSVQHPMDPDAELNMWTVEEVLLVKQQPSTLAEIGKGLSAILFCGNLSLVGLLASVSMGLLRLRKSGLDAKVTPRVFV